MRRALAALSAGVLLAAPGIASAAGPPVLPSLWASEVVSGSARLHARVNPNGAATFYRFDYIASAAYEANVSAGKDPFAGASKAPVGAEATAGAGSTPLEVFQLLSPLLPETAYRYRAVARNGFGTVTSATHSLRTQGLGGEPLLLDGRAWEMVSPVEKQGGQIGSPGSIFGGGVFQAAAGGGAIAYSSATSFGAGAQSAPQGSQYLATRTGSGWTTANITTPMLSGTYGAGAVGVPYQLFSVDLARGLLLSGRPCRNAGTACPVANPPLTGSGAPVGYQNYYLRRPDGSFAALIDAAALSHSDLDAAHFEVMLAGASTDLRHVVLSSCAALATGATEAAAGDGCDPASQNLYEWAEGALSLIGPSPGAALAAPAGAISADGSRVYFTQGGNLFLRAGAQTRQVDAPAGGGGAFQLASADGSLAYFTKEGHLWQYAAASDSATDLTPAGGVAGVLGASVDSTRVYYLSAAGLFLHDGAATIAIASGADAAEASSYPPATGTARVSTDGERLAFTSTAPLTDFDNTDQSTGEADSEVYLYDARTDALACVSCNRTGARPLGPSLLPGAHANGALPGSLQAYEPRSLSVDGRRLFFDSTDDLVLGDTDGGARDVYEWEAPGSGSCARAGGCLALISSGRGSSPSSFLDASADGGDAYFLTDRSLVGADPGSVDLYDARVGGGFAEPVKPIPCEGDACQTLPSPPPDPAVTTLIKGPGNPAVRYPKRGHHHKRHKQKRKQAKRSKAKEHRRGRR